MISKEGGELCCTCDNCGEQEFGGTLEFHKFWEGLKAKGWVAEKVRDSGDEDSNEPTWEHYCPECKT